MPLFKISANGDSHINYEMCGGILVRMAVQLVLPRLTRDSPHLEHFVTSLCCGLFRNLQALINTSTIMFGGAPKVSIRVHF